MMCSDNALLDFTSLLLIIQNNIRERVIGSMQRTIITKGETLNVGPYIAAIIY